MHDLVEIDEIAFLQRFEIERKKVPAFARGRRFRVAKLRAV
jgi:hypothetical protein